MRYTLQFCTLIYRGGYCFDARYSFGFMQTVYTMPIQVCLLKNLQLEDPIESMIDISGIYVKEKVSLKTVS